MKPNVKVQNFLEKHKESIVIIAHTDNDAMLLRKLETLFAEMYNLGYTDGYADGWGTI